MKEYIVWVYGGETVKESCSTFENFLMVLRNNQINYHAYKNSRIIITKNVVTRIVALDRNNKENKMRGVMVDEAFGFGIADRFHLTSSLGKYRGTWLDYITEKEVEG